MKLDGQGIPPTPFVKGVANERYKKFNPGMLKLPININNIEKASKLRKNMTEPERRVWNKLLSKSKLEQLRFLKQRPVGHYIVDFFCSKLLLAIEIDGNSHFTKEGVEYDKQRTHYLSLYGIKVIRYTNKEVMENIEGVFIDLKEQIKKRKNELKMN